MHHHDWPCPNQQSQLESHWYFWIILRTCKLWLGLKKIESTKEEHIWTTIIIWLQFTTYRCGAYALRYIVIAQNPKVGWLKVLNNNLNIEYCPRLHYMYTCKMQGPLQYKRFWSKKSEQPKPSWKCWKTTNHQSVSK